MNRKMTGILFAFAMGCMSTHATPVQAANSASLTAIPKYAAILIDPQSGEVLYAHQADAARHPASITKVMTLFILFEEIRAGRVKMSDRISFSYTARSQAPSRLGVGPNQTLSVDEAIQALVTKSANDVAYAVAEHISGTEAKFAERMNKRAAELGMKSSHFANASGLPNSAHRSSARDIATLSRAMLSQFPNFYTYFRQRQFTWGGRVMPNHNKLLGNALGVDGIKTGYTALSGFTLAAAASHNGKRLIAVVLGAPTSIARNNNVEALLRAGYAMLEERQAGRKGESVSARLDATDDIIGDKINAISALRQVSAKQVDEQSMMKPAVLKPTVKFKVGSGQRAGSSSGGNTLK